MIFEASCFTCLKAKLKLYKHESSPQNVYENVKWHVYKLTSKRPIQIQTHILDQKAGFQTVVFLFFIYVILKNNFCIIFHIICTSMIWKIFTAASWKKVESAPDCSCSLTSKIISTRLSFKYTILNFLSDSDSIFNSLVTYWYDST